MPGGLILVNEHQPGETDGKKEVIISSRRAAEAPHMENTPVLARRRACPLWCKRSEGEGIGLVQPEGLGGTRQPRWPLDVLRTEPSPG